MVEIQELKVGKNRQGHEPVMPEAGQDVFLSSKDLEKRWGTTEMQIINMRGRGIGPKYIRIGHRTIRYRLRDVIAYEQSREMTVTA